MDSFAKLRSEMNKKYGNEKEDEKKEKKTSSSSTKSNFQTIRQEMEEKYNPKVTVDTSYINTFISDAGKYMDSMEADFKGMGVSSSESVYNQRKKEADDLRARSWAINQFLADNKDSLDPDRYKNLTSYLDSFDDASAQSIYDFYRNREYYSQWDTDEAYKTYLKEQKAYDDMLNFDLNAGQKEIDKLESAVAEYSELDKWYKANRAGKDNENVTDPKVKKMLDRYNELQGWFADEHGGTDNLDGIVSDKRAYMNRAKRLQNGVALSSVIDPESEYYDPDFDKYSGYKSTMKGKFLGQPISIDEDYESVNYRQSDYSLAERSARAATTGDTEEQEWLVSLSRMTEDEVSIYNYYYAKYGSKKAKEYLNSIQETLNSRVAEANFEGLEGHTAMELLFGVQAGLDQFQSGVVNLLNTTDDYIVPSATQIASGMVREDLADAGLKLPDWIGGVSLGQAAYDTVTTTANMAPSIIASAVVSYINPVAGQVVGSALMGASAAGNAYAEVLNMGYSKEQARAYSTMVGASEAGLQYLLGGVSKLGGKLTGKALSKILDGVDNAIFRTAIKLGGNMLSEGMEEGLQEVLTPWFKNLALHVDEDINWSEVAYSGLLGAITAGFMEGGGTIAGEVSTYKTGKQLQAADISATRLAEIGSTFSADTVAYQLAGRVNENTGAYTIGRLFNEIGATMTEQNVNDITNALVAKGMDARTARKNAEALAYVVEGGQLTDLQVAAIESNDVLAEVARTTLVDANTTWNQRSHGYNEMLKALADEMTSPKASRTNPAQQTEENAPISDMVDDQKEIGAESLSEAEIVDTSPAKVKNISDISKMTIKLEDGSEVNVRDADLDPDDGVRIETIASIDGISTEDANFVLNTLRTTTNASAQMDSLGAKEVYRYGFYGFSEDHIAKHGVFANSLTEAQRKAIYDTGKNARQKQIEKASTTKITSKQSGVYFDYGSGNVVAFKDANKSLVSEAKRSAGVQTAVILNKLGIGGDIYFFESYRNSKGQLVYKNSKGVEVKAPNGWYSETDGSIHIDLNSGRTGEGLVLFTMAHELTHFIEQWSPKKYKILADFLIENYEKGQSMDKLVRAKQDKLAALRGKEISYKEAYSEVIADSMEAMLADGNVMEKLYALKAKDSSLFMKIKQFFDNLLTKIRNAYKGLTPDSDEGKAVMEMTDSIEKIQQLFAEALVEASENYQASEQVLADAGISVNSETDSGSLLSVRDVLNDSDRKKVAKALAERFNVTEKEAMAWLTAETSLASLILNPKYSTFLDYEADPNEVAIKQNSDYPQGTVDFSNICKKRREFTQVMNRILRNFPNHVFAATDLARIRTIMGEEGMTLPCGICYVEDRRQLDTIVAQDFINGLQLYREGSKTRPDGKPFNANQLKGLQLTDGDTYVPTVYELVTLEGRNSLKAKNPNMEAAWVRYNNARGMQAVRLLTNEAEYKRQILKYNKNTVKSKNDHGGLRIYSFSDMEMFHLIDIVQVITDSSAVGLMIQGYTKVNEYAKAVKDTGEKLNRSLIPKGDLGYHMENGKIVLDYDPVEGIDIYSEDFFDSKDNPNVGNITIGINDTQIRAAMVSDFVDYIIPFHTGQSEEVLGEKGIAAWDNYKDFQTEKDLATGKTSSHQVNIYTEVFQAAEEDGKPIQNKRQFVEKFLEVCKENGLKPRFAQFLNTDANGDYTYTEGYHKFLVDFKTFAQTEVGEYLPQMPVKPIFDNAYITGLLEAYVKEQQVKDAEVAKQMPRVIERITNEIIKTETEDVFDTHVQWSLRDEAPPKKTKVGYKAFFVKDGKLYPPMVANPSGAGTPVGVWLNADTGSPMRDSEGKLIQNKSGRAKVAAGGKGTKGGGGSLAWRPGWHLGPIPDATQFSVDPASKEWSEWLQKTGKAAGVTKNIGNKGNPIFLNPHIVFAEVEFAADVDYQLEAYEYGVNKKGKFDHSQAGIPYVIKDGYYRYRTNSMAPGALSWYITGAMKVNRILTDAECRKLCAKEGRDMMPRLGGDFDFASHGLTAGDVTPTEDLSSVAPKQDFSDEVLKLPGYVRRGLDFSDPNFRKAFEDDSIADKLEYYENLYNETDAKKFSDRDSDGNQLSKEQQEFFKDSKVRDAEGNLMVMYHGTANGGAFTVFDGDKLGNDTRTTQVGQGFYFTNMKAEAKAYTKNVDTYGRTSKGKNPHLHQVYLNITNPFNIDSDTLDIDKVKSVYMDGTYDYFFSNWIPFYLKNKTLDGRTFTKAEIEAMSKADKVSVYVDYLAQIGTKEVLSNMVRAFPYGKQSELLTAMKKRLGYDGIVEEFKPGQYQYVAFSAEQIKATGNQNPTSDPDIRYSDRDYMDAVNRGDMETAQKMVDEAAKAAGYTTMGFHGSGSAGFTVVDRYSMLWLARDEAVARGYGAHEDVESGKPHDEYGVYAMVYNLGKNLYIDADGFDWGSLPVTEEEYPGVYVDEETGDITTNAMAEWALGHGYDSITFANVNDGGFTTVDVVFNPNRDAKSSNPVTYDDNGNVIPLSERFNQTNDDIRYQDRADDSVSNRSLLANAFEGVAQNDIEKQKIQEYKDKISLINSEERKLSELNEKIKELSFSKGPRDTKAIRDLQFEARQTANRISTYDKQLLRLEASKPLQDVLTREKKMAYKRAEQKGKEALAAYREKATNTQRKLLEKWQESRKKGIESREKTAMRHKIQHVVGELNDLLLSNDKKRHVPENLKKAVADALALVNMDTVGAEERAAKYAALIAKETDPDKIDAYTVTMENILRQGEKMGQRLKELRDAYEEISESDDPEIANAYDPVIAGSLKELAQSIGNTSLRNMTLEQLSDVYDMYRMVLTRVRDANKSFLNDKKEAISNLASRVVGEVRRVGGEHKVRAAIFDFAKKFGWNNLKPVYAFEHIGSSTLSDAFSNVRAGEDVWAVDVTHAREYYLDKSKKYGYNSWDFKKKYQFESASGLKFDLTLDQILSLYAYSKRDQAHDHLKLGGFVFDSDIETYKEKGSKILKYKVNTADAHQITPEILASITGTLTNEQMAFVDEMQDYLSTVMGAKGNEIAMKMYGVKLFKEKFYFPLKSAKQFMFEQNQVAGEVKIKNSGFTNKVVVKANNPIILRNFMDVWAGHVNDMSMYHAFVLPLEDFNRIFNYNSPKKEGQPPVSVKGTIQNAYSPAAVNYVRQLITDLNGGARTDSTTDIISKLTGLFKKGAVFASASVVVQQPSAIARAFALVDSKYFIGPKVDRKRHKALWEEVKQYAPVAIIKEMGYFDTNMGKSTQDFITAKEYSGIGEKMKALVVDSGYRDEILSKAPALADELAWCGIWEAVKRETKVNNPGMDVKSEAFLQKAGKRFTEVIVKTQVYDSVLARSGFMRSKDTGMKMATAFMAEPTTSINMIADALLQGKRGNKRYARKAIGAVIAAQILNSILVSFVYAGRDDDEDETYIEKYIGSFTAEMLDGLNPATYIPFIKDIVSIVQGYDVERSDMAVISDLWKAWENLSKDNMSTYRKVEGFAGSIAQIFGLPVKNIMRDVRGIYQTIDSFVNGQQTTKAGVGYAVKGAITGKTVSDQQQLYEAYLSGDKAQIARVEGRFKDQTAINTAIRKALRENDPRIKEAAKAKVSGDLDEYLRIAKAILAEKHFSQDNVVAAINAEINALNKGETTASTPKASGMFKAEDFAVAISQDDHAMANAIKTDIIQTAQKNGKTAEEAEKSFVSSATSACKELFLSGDITEGQAVEALETYCDKTEDEAMADVQYWAFKQDYPDVYADDAWFDKYYEEVADSGVSIDVYMDYRNQVKDIAGEGKKERRMAVINSLPITSAQKDALYYAEGWAESKLYEAPWH